MADEVEKDIKHFCAESRLFANKTIVLEKTANTGLLQKVKPCNQQFFDLLFNGLFWDVYSELDFASKPVNSRYLAFVASEMFFCRNTVQRFLSKLGPEKQFSYSNGEIQESTPLTLSNALFFAAAPFELARNAASLSVAALKVNKELPYFEQHYRQSFFFWDKNKSVRDPLEMSRLALQGALYSMRFSILSSIAAYLKIRLRNSFATRRNFLKLLILKAADRDKSILYKKHGYFSISPYDISSPFLEEKPEMTSLLRKIPPPEHPHYIWRENAKLCCSMHLSVLRKCFQSVARKSGFGNDIFFLQPRELHLALDDREEALGLTIERKKIFEKNSKISLPRKIAVVDRKPLFEEMRLAKEAAGVSVGSKTTAKGRLVFVEGSNDLKKVKRGDIIFSKNFSPELVLFYGKCAGVISESGGMLAHSAIVARESGLPCIVQVRGVALLEEDTPVIVDGITGKISISQK